MRLCDRDLIKLNLDMDNIKSFFEDCETGQKYQTYQRARAQTPPHYAAVKNNRKKRYTHILLRKEGGTRKGLVRKRLRANYCNFSLIYFYIF